MPKRIVILGSTGSIGQNALRVVKHLGPEYRVLGLSAAQNGKELLEQARRFRPRWISLFDAQAARNLEKNVDGFTRLLPPGVEGLAEMASHPDVDLVLTSLVGGVGFAPLLAALRAGKSVALANKEPMVMAGELLMKEAERWKAKIIPVDSEPSAIFQCLNGAGSSVPGPRPQIRRIWLTASGGPFYSWKSGLKNVTVKQALAHPNWRMGKKITVDSATLMNKGFETIEIKNLFGLELDQIQVVIHPQSILHSAVELSDGSVLAQLSPPDMALPIQYAITFPERQSRLIEPLDLFSVKRLDFDKPDFRKFPCLALAREAARTGGTLPAILSAADEVAVEAFLSRRLRFTDIPLLLEKVMARHPKPSRPVAFSDIAEADSWAREKSKEIISCLPRP